MSAKLYQRLQAIKDVEREFGAARLATERLLAEAHRDPTILQGNLAVRDVGHAAERLEGTYLVRLFAEFEAGLRVYWSEIRETYPPMRDLLDGIAATRRIPDDNLKHVHEVRKFRNSLVHERTDDLPQIPISQARSHLCKFFAFLPPNW